MRERILETALRLCRIYGIKSITMQDIARECGISKKTVYENFADKSELVDAVTSFMAAEYSRLLEDCTTQSNDAVEEIALSIRHTEHMCKSINPVLLYELEKYHPAAWKKIQEFKNDFVGRILRNNIHRGILEGLYRSNFNIDILVHMRLQQLDGLFKPAEYPAADFEVHEVLHQLTTHYLNGIATPAGQRLVDKYLPEQLTA